MANSYEVIESASRDRATVDVLEWGHLGAPGVPGQQSLRHQFTQPPVRQVRLTLQGGAGFVLESGMLHFLKGRIAIENKIKGVVGRMFSAAVSGEAVFRPTYTGAGEVWLEPSLGHYLLVGLDNETVIVDQGTFVACEASVAVSVEMQRNVSSALFGGEGLFQTKLTGSGLAILSSAVPEFEIVKYALEPGERVMVDGTFAIMRSASVAFSVGKSSRTWLGSTTTGDGLLQTFEGPGDVWLAPTMQMYGLSHPALPSMPEAGRRARG